MTQGQFRSFEIEWTCQTVQCTYRVHRLEKIKLCVRLDWLRLNVGLYLGQDDNMSPFLFYVIAEGALGNRARLSAVSLKNSGELSPRE